MSIALIVTLRIQDGKEAEFEAFFSELARQVRAGPGILAYQMAKSRTEPNTYKAIEVFKDQEAITHHGGTEYIRAAGPKIGAMLAGQSEVEYLDGLD